MWWRVGGLGDEIELRPVLPDERRVTERAQQLATPVGKKDVAGIVGGRNHGQGHHSDKRDKDSG